MTIVPTIEYIRLDEFQGKYFLSLYCVAESLENKNQLKSMYRSRPSSWYRPPDPTKESNTYFVDKKGVG